MLGLLIVLSGFYVTMSEFFATLLVLGTLPSIVFLVLYTAISLIFITRDYYWPIGVYTVLLFVVFVFFGQLHPIDFLREHPWAFVGWILAYFGIGLVWMLIRYIRFLSRMSSKRNECLKAFIKNEIPNKLKEYEKAIGRGEAAPSQEEVAEWVKVLTETRMAPEQPYELSRSLTMYLDEKSRRHYYPMNDYGQASSPPVWENHKWDFASIWTYWPFDVLSYLLGDLLRDIFRFINKYLQGVLDRISRKIFVKPLS